MKSYLFILFTFIVLGANAQNIVGKITFDEDYIHIGVDTSRVKDAAVKGFMLMRMNAIKAILSGDQELYTLKFNKTEAIFGPIPKMASDVNPNYKRVVSQNLYYTNLKTRETFRKMSIFGNTYRVKKGGEKFEWEITGETRKIQGYTCYHATTILANSSKIIHAWFTPAIPISLGPKGYGGLPGLILGLKEHGRYMHAKKIILNKKEIDIIRPSKRKLISEEELSAMIRGTMEKI